MEKVLFFEVIVKLFVKNFVEDGLLFFVESIGVVFVDGLGLIGFCLFGKGKIVFFYLMDLVKELNFIIDIKYVEIIFVSLVIVNFNFL